MSNVGAVMTHGSKGGRCDLWGNGGAGAICRGMGTGAIHGSDVRAGAIHRRMGG